MNKILRTTAISFALIIGAIVLLIGFALLWPSNEDRARAVATEFVEQLQHVPLTVDEASVKQAISQRYTQYVTPELLEQWLADPESAPGRERSDLWPDHIFIKRVEQQGESYILNADVLYVTSVEAETPDDDAAGVMIVTILVILTDDGWRIAAYAELFGEGLDDTTATSSDQVSEE